MIRRIRADAMALAVPLLLAALMLFLIVSYPGRMHPDVAVNLHMGGLLLDGKLPYVDFFDTNPPLIFYLSAIPVGLSRLFHCDLILLCNGSLLALTVASTLVMYSQLRVQYQAGSSLILSAWLLCSAYLLYAHEHGQREQLFVLAYGPLFWVRAGRRSPDGAVGAGWALFCVGAFAGLFAALKPTFVVSAIVPELYWLAVYRDPATLRKPEVAGFVSIGALYALHFVFIPAAMRHSFFYHWLPILLRHYHVYDAPFTELTALDGPVIFPLGALALWCFLRSAAPARADRLAASTPLLLFTLTVFVLNYLVAGKPWPYHAVPAMFGAALVMTTTIAERLRPAEHDDLWGKVASLASIACSLVCFHSQPIADLNERSALWGIVETVTQYTKPGDEVLAVSGSVGPLFPALTIAKRKQAFSYAYAFPVPMAYENVSSVNGAFPYRTKDFPPIEAEFLQVLDRDLRRSHPKLVVLENGDCQACPPDFDFADYLAATGFIGELTAYDRRQSKPDDPFLFFVLRE